MEDDKKPQELWNSYVDLLAKLGEVCVNKQVVHPGFAKFTVSREAYDELPHDGYPGYYLPKPKTLPEHIKEIVIEVKSPGYVAPVMLDPKPDPWNDLIMEKVAKKKVPKAAPAPVEYNIEYHKAPVYEDVAYDGNFYDEDAPQIQGADYGANPDNLDDYLF